MTKHRIAIADDHRLVRESIAGTIERLGDYAVTLQSSNGLELLATLQSNDLPDLVILDIDMPGLGGLETLEQIQSDFPTLKCLMLTFDHDEQKIIRAFRHGARGYLLKESSPEDFHHAIQSILQTGYYYNEMIHQAMMREPVAERKPEGPRLTEREKQFLLLLCDPQEPTYEQIADRMKVHKGTVDGYRAALFDKYSIRSKTGLVLFAIKNGIVKI